MRFEFLTTIFLRSETYVGWWFLSLAEWLQLSSRNAWPLEMKALFSFETSRITKPMTQYHFPEGLNAQKHGNLANFWGMIRLTLLLLTLTKWWASASASKWRMGFNSAFKGLNPASIIRTICGWVCHVKGVYACAIARACPHIYCSSTFSVRCNVKNTSICRPILFVKSM
jgi:hypothetical protein